MGLFLHYEGSEKKGQKKEADLIITNSDLLTSLVLVIADLCICNIFAER